MTPFTLTFDRPSAGALAVEISGWPGAPFTALMDMVTAAMGRTGAAYKPGPSRYPHIALGYTTDAADVLDAVTLRASLASIEKSPAAIPGQNALARDSPGGRVAW
ncbi:hypothetical protein ACFWVF_21685 [Streptomyces sp. NPDC058659]|uniref:hypothetical protein n=1 Tax=unclassified Streptomyces TaxID=2593676 RepID=UPI00364ED482